MPRLPFAAGRTLLRPQVLVVLAVVLGAVLRLLWLGDIEYKGDELYMVERMREVADGAPWPELGQPSNAGVRNPSLSVWIFVALGQLLGVTDPVGVARIVAVMGVLALVGLTAFAFRWVPLREREPWLWGTALLALNPLDVLFGRKIWIPSILPLFSLAALVGWWRRDTRGGALVWGIAGALLGQIHLSGFFFAAGIAGWTALFRRAGTRWRWWLVGTVLGALPAIRWLQYLLTTEDSAARSVKSLVTLGFWRTWLGHVTGLDLHFSLGDDFDRFLGAPRIAGTPTYLVTALHLVIAAAALWIAWIALRRLWAARGTWTDRDWLRRLATGGGTDTGTLAVAAFIPFGVLMTLSLAIVYRHYVLVAFVLPFVWIALLALLSPRSGRRALAVLCVAQAVLSISFLAWIHDNRGAAGDYGVSYDAQTPAQRPTAPPPPPED